jgi:WD40 repeat protein
MTLYSLRKPIVLLLLVFLLAGAVYYFRLPPAPHAKFSTSYQDFPEPKPAPPNLPKTLVDVPGTIRSFDISPDGTTIAIATSTGLVLYNLASLEKINTLPMGGGIRDVAFSQDGDKLAVIQNITEYYEYGYIYLTVFDTNSWGIQYNYQNDGPNYLYSASGRLAWNPDGKRIAFVIPEQGLSVWNIETSSKPEAMPDSVFPSEGFAWSPDGTRLIATEAGFGLRRWRVDTGEWVRLYDQQSQPPSQVQWSIDGRHIVSGHFGGTLCVWNANNNQCEGFIRAHFNSVDGLGWSPHSRQIATSSGVIRIWDAKTGEEKSAFGFAKSGTYYNKLEWIDEQALVTMESSFTENNPSIIRFWDIGTGDVKFAFRGWQEMQSPNTNGITLRVDDVWISKKETLIQASLFFDIPNVSVQDWEVSLHDKNGKLYPLTRVTDVGFDSDTTYLYRTAPLPKGMSFTLELNKRSGLPVVRGMTTEDSSFMFDSSTLQVGEAVEMNQEIYASDFLFYLTKAEKVSPTELHFEFFTSNNIDSVRLDTPFATGSSSTPEGVGRFSATLSFSRMPRHILQFMVDKVYYKAIGPWSVEFEVFDSMFVK